MFPSRYVSCSDCGASIEHGESLDHECEPERWLDYQLFHLRDEIDRFEAELSAYLTSPSGAFEVWHAERSRGGRPSTG
jgi:hypothetical protein